MTKIVCCPTCGASTKFDKGNPFRPFCSERCQILDLGAWADEKYVVPENLSEEESESPSVNEKQNDPTDETRQDLTSLQHRLLN